MEGACGPLAGSSTERNPPTGRSHCGACEHGGGAWGGRDGGEEAQSRFALPPSPLDKFAAEVLRHPTSPCMPGSIAMSPVPSDLFPLVQEFLSENGLSSSLKAFKAETKGVRAPHVACPARASDTHAPGNGA